MRIKKTLALFTLLGMMMLAMAGEKPIVKVADMYYKQFDFKNAIELYKRALKKDAQNPYVLQKMADSYRMMNDWAAAEEYYAKLAGMDNANVINKLYYAEALRAN